MSRPLYYRLADMIVHFPGPNAVRGVDPAHNWTWWLVDRWDEFVSTYPDSLVVKYWDQAKQPNDMNILSAILDQQSTIGPNDNVCCVHLRTGDAIEGSKYTAREHFDECLPSIPYAKGKYVKSKKHISKYLNRLTDEVSEIKLVTGNHKQDVKLDKSLEYVRLVSNYFNTLGYNVSEHITRSADYISSDDDFIYMSKSKYYIPTGGGFSILIDRIIKHRHK